MRWVSINRLDVCRTNSYTPWRYKDPKTEGGENCLFQGLVKYVYGILQTGGF
jgi:hypothetical protein